MEDLIEKNRQTSEQVKTVEQAPEKTETTFSRRLRDIRKMTGRLLLITSIGAGGIEFTSGLSQEATSEPKIPSVSKQIEGSDGVLLPEQMQALMRDTYPKGWFEDVADVKVLSKALPSGLGGSPEDEVGAVNGFSGSSTIELYSERIKQRPLEYLINHIFSHESGHAVQDGMPDAQWEALRAGIIGRLSAPDRYLATHIRLRSGSTTDEELKAKEYWAEIVAQYFRDPYQLNIKDFRMVDAVVKMKDSKFDVLQKNSERTIALLGASLPDVKPTQ